MLAGDCKSSTHAAHLESRGETTMYFALLRPTILDFGEQLMLKLLLLSGVLTSFPDCDSVMQTLSIGLQPFGKPVVPPS